MSTMFHFNYTEGLFFKVKDKPEYRISDLIFSKDTH